MEKETDTDKILRAIAGVHARVDELGEATKHDLTALKTEMVEFVAGEFAKLRTEDIEPMKRDIANLKQASDKVWNVFAPRLEYDDCLRLIEQKLGIPSPN
jgi:aspartyl/asparaginyl-tRNA synthetase